MKKHYEEIKEEEIKKKFEIFSTFKIATMLIYPNNTILQELKSKYKKVEFKQIE